MMVSVARMAARRRAAVMRRDLVAGGTAVAVVNLLEGVEVEQVDTHLVLIADGAGDGLLDAVLQQQMVGQAGEGIELILAEKLADLTPAGGNVACGDDQTVVELGDVVTHPQAVPGSAGSRGNSWIRGLPVKTT